MSVCIFPFLSLVSLSHFVINIDLKGNYDTNTPVAVYRGPDELKKVFDTEIPLEGVGLNSILNDLETTMKYSVRTGHIRFFNQLWAGSDVAGKREQHIIQKFG